MAIQGKAVLVTGASRGLGAALADELAWRGARLALVSRGAAELEEVAGRLRARGAVAHALAADVAEPEAAYPLIGTATALLGPLDVLVHNASALGPTPLRELLETDARDFARVLEANLLGPFRLTRAVAGSMALRGRGLVLAVSSDAAVNGYAGWGAYGVSKAGLDHLVRSWAAELGDAGVRFLSVDPGEMDTRMHADADPTADRSTLARPADVARRLADVIEAPEAWPNGARLEPGQWRRAA